MGPCGMWAQPVCRCLQLAGRTALLATANTSAHAGPHAPHVVPRARARAVPMKTPLSRDILANWSLPEQPRYRLTVPELLEQQSALGRRIGLILDLSNHECRE